MVENPFPESSRVIERSFPDSSALNLVLDAATQEVPLENPVPLYFSPVPVAIVELRRTLYMAPPSASFATFPDILTGIISFVANLTKS